MTQQANAPVQPRGVAETSVICAAKHNTEDIPNSSKFQDACWQAFRLSVEVDLAERSPESHTLRIVAHRVWSASFLADGGAI